MSSTIRADGAHVSGADRRDHHRVGLVQPGRVRLVVPAAEHRDRVGQPGRPRPARRGCTPHGQRPPSRGRIHARDPSHDRGPAGLRRRTAQCPTWLRMRDGRGTRRARGRRRLRDRDRRARQGGLRAALPRRRHRGDRRPGAVRERLGAADRRHLHARALPRPSPTTSRSTPATSASTCRPRSRCWRRRFGLRPDLRHQRRAGPRGPRPGRGDGAVVRRPVGARARARPSCRSARSTRADRSPSGS